MRPGVLFGALFLPLAAGAAPPLPAAFPPSSNAFPSGSSSPSPSASLLPPAKLDAVGALLTGALPADGTTDVVLIDWPATPGTPHVRAVTVVGAAPAAVRNVLLDAANYRKIVPALLRADVSRTATGLPSVGWEVEVPLFNLSGTLVIHERPDGADVDLVDGDFSPGKLIFTAIPRAAGGSILMIDAQLNIRNAGWLIRRLVKLSPAGEPAALVAASYVTLRAVGLRAENANIGGARRPGATPAPPPVWSPSRWSAAPGRSGWRAWRSLPRWAFRRRTRWGGCAIRRHGTRSRAGARSNRARVRTASARRWRTACRSSISKRRGWPSRVIHCAGRPPMA